MKCLHLIGCILLTLQISQGKAQEKIPLNQRSLEKPALFDQLPDRFTRQKGSLESLFNQEKNSPVKTVINDQLRIEGVIMEKVDISPEQCNINIRCTNLQNALLNVTRISQPDGTFKYVGLIFSPLHGDILMLGADKDPYAVTKQKQRLTMVE